MSVQQQQLYCFRCGDFVYDAEVDMATAHERSVAIGRMQYLNSNLFFLSLSLLEILMLK
jgi:hypothetical protein